MAKKNYELKEFESKDLADVEDITTALDRYELDFDRMCSLLNDNLEKLGKKKGVDAIAEIRKTIDMVIRIKGGYAPSKHEFDHRSIVYKWKEPEKVPEAEYTEGEEGNNNP